MAEVANLASVLVWATASPTPSPSPTALVPATAGSGDSPLDWLTAIGTVGAVVVALAFGIVAERRTRQDRLDRATEAVQASAAARRAQAERVAIWAVEDMSRIDGGTGHPAVSIHLVNASDLPVVHVHVPGNDLWDGWIPQSLLPGETKYVDLTFDQLLEFDEPIASPPPDNERLRVTFQDNAGVIWIRAFTGELWEWPRPSQASQ